MVVAEQTDGHIVVVLQKPYGVSMLTTTWLVYGINWARMILLNNPQSVQYALRMLAPTVRIFSTHFSVNRANSQYEFIHLPIYTYLFTT